MMFKSEHLADGRLVKFYKISDKMGLNATILNYGAIIQSLEFNFENETRQLVLGYDTAQEYVENTYYMGCVVGRVAGRIADCKAEIDGKIHNLSDNSCGIHLHGGEDGFNSKIFHVVEHTESSIVLEYISKDGESGYPGELCFRVEYRLENSCLIVNYFGKSTKSTFLCPTQHTYFLLGGDNIYSHSLRVNADNIYELNEKYLRTGKKLPLDGNPLDFREDKNIQNVLKSNNIQLEIANGIDHSYILNEVGQDIRECAVLKSQDLQMECLTNMSVLHLYSSNFLSQHKGRNSKIYDKHGAICLEFQDTLCDENGILKDENILRANDEYNKTVIYRFSKI